eukprot:scaffold47933_cov68-Cyclotella_meneghiniana.AAC.16
MSTRAISCSILLIVRSTIVACLITKQRCSPRALLVVRSSSVSDGTDLLEMQKSPESSFWRVTPQPRSPLSSLPSIHGIERETGRLPPGAYQPNGNIDESESYMCLIGVKVRPPLNSKQGDDIWAAGAKNAQRLIDSGFNTFNVGNTYKTAISNNKTQNDRNRLTKKSIAAAKKHQDLYTAEIRQRHDSETQFYGNLRQSTPPSILRLCNFAVDINIPSVLHVSDPIMDKGRPAPNVPFGNGWAVRKTISDALLRVKSDCLDTVKLECKFTHKLV